MTVPRKDLGGQSKAGISAIQHAIECWEALGYSPLKQNYFYLQGRFYAMNNWSVAAWLLVMFAAIVLVGFVFEVKLFAAIAIVVLTGVLSAMLIWLIERPPKQ